jgi:acyl-CoA dehydrogenase
MTTAEESDLITSLGREIFTATADIPLHELSKGSQLDNNLWDTITQSGLESLLASDEDNLRDAVSVLHYAGYYTARVPIAEALLAHWLAMKAGWEEHGVPVVVERAPATSLVSGTDGSLTATGELPNVPWGRYATAVYVLDQGRIVRIDAAGARATHGENVAGEPRDTLALSGAAVKRSSVTIEADDLLARAALLRAALMVGAMDRTLDLSVEHASTRVQFGKSIGKFQAVQQLLAVLATNVAAAAAAVDLAADRGTPFAIAIAKARAGEAAGLSAEIAHQVIAAMGFTLEHPLHLATRRLWSWRDEAGSESYWNARIGKTVCEAGGSALWPMVTDLGPVLQQP